MNDLIKEAVKDYFEKDVPEDIRRLAGQATNDLYFGPYETDEEYPGFVTAVAAVREWVSDNIPAQVWVDEDGEVFLRDPELDYPYYELEYKDTLECLFNSELISYIC